MASPSRSGPPPLRTKNGSNYYRGGFNGSCPSKGKEFGRFCGCVGGRGDCWVYIVGKSENNCEEADKESWEVENDEEEWDEESWAEWEHCQRDTEYGYSCQEIQGDVAARSEEQQEGLLDPAPSLRPSGFPKKMILALCGSNKVAVQKIHEREFKDSAKILKNNKPMQLFLTNRAGTTLP